MLKRFLSLLSLLILVCAGGASARAQAPEPCEPKLPTDAAFWADVTPMPEGTGNFSYAMDLSQEKDASAPVIVTRLEGVTSQQHRGGKLRCVEFANRSARTVRAVQLSWTLTARDDPEKKVLARGRLPLVEVEVAPGGRRKVELREGNFADFLLPLVREGIHAGAHDLRVRVSRAVFTDGTVVDEDDPR